MAAKKTVRAKKKPEKVKATEQKKSRVWIWVVIIFFVLIAGFIVIAYVNY